MSEENRSVRSMATGLDPSCESGTKRAMDTTALARLSLDPMSEAMTSLLARTTHDLLSHITSLDAIGIHQASRCCRGWAGGASDSSVDSEALLLQHFIYYLVKASNTSSLTLLATLVYLHRLKGKLALATRKYQCTMYRIFLAALIVATKYLHDWSPRNKKWAKYSRWSCGPVSFRFTLPDVNLMEVEMLSLLEWRLGVTEDDFLHVQMPSVSHIGQARTNHQVRHTVVHEPSMDVWGIQSRAKTSLEYILA